METILREDPNLLSGTVHREVLVILKSREYLALAQYLKMPINLAWGRLKQGRKVKKVTYDNQAIFQLTIDPEAKQVGSIIDERALEEAFAEAGAVGRVSADRYELELARKLMSNFGTTVG